MTATLLADLAVPLMGTIVALVILGVIVVTLVVALLLSAPGRRR